MRAACSRRWISPKCSSNSWNSVISLFLRPPGVHARQFEHPAENNPEMPVIWRGKLIYDEQRTLAVWAKVRISVDREVSIARETIPKGAVIRADQVATTRVRQFPTLELNRSSPLITMGKVARRTLEPVSRLSRKRSTTPKTCYGVRLCTSRRSMAERAFVSTLSRSRPGKRGEMILVHNPSSGRNFRALSQDGNRWSYEENCEPRQLRE